jgi:endonuclease/exonuclease/phosphatase (EEP) superfamily protein YafD
MNSNKTESNASPEPLPKPLAPWLPRRLHNLIMAALFLVVVFSLARFGARWSAWCELFSHFALQYGLLLLLGAAYAFAVAAPRNALVMLAFASFNLSLLLPYAIPKALPPESGRVIPIAAVNVLIKNRDFRQTLNFVESANPDVLLVAEVDEEWLSALDALGYENSKKFPASAWLGMGIYSRYEIIAQEPFPKGSTDPFACAWTLKVEDKELVVIGVHPPPPEIPPTSQRQAMLEQMTQFIHQFSAEKPTVVMGDLNVTPWSPYLENMIQDAKLSDARIGQGVVQTWPAQIPPLWIPIDHCLVSKDIMLHRFYRGPSIGSDHFPILCRISIPSQDSLPKPLDQP